MKRQRDEGVGGTNRIGVSWRKQRIGSEDSIMWACHSRGCSHVSSIHVCCCLSGVHWHDQVWHGTVCTIKETARG